MPFTPSTAQQIFDFIVGDFESAWNAIASQEEVRPRGNYMFALLSMILLEFACRVCKSDPTGGKLSRLSQALGRIEPLYYTRLPGTWGRTTEFTLPGPMPESHLLGMMFDIIRNGKAHQYQSPMVKLADGDIDFGLTGALPQRSLLRPNKRRSRKHLRFKALPPGDLQLYVRTEQLFLDIKTAINKATIIQPTDTVLDIERPKPRPTGRGVALARQQHYNFTVADVKNSLLIGGHKHL